MSYNYQTERKEIFTEEGQVLFLKIRDKARECLRIAGAVMMEKLIYNNVGSSWTMMACVDRLVELKELREITPSNCIGQYRVFADYNWGNR